MKKLLFAIALCLAFAPADARIARSHSAKVEFARTHVCPSTLDHKLPCPGYVIDHIKPIACGGADKPSNMQYQTIAEGKKKDKWERVGCDHQAITKGE